MTSTAREEAYQRIYALVDSVPPGCVATYGQIARESGLPRHARLVGRALAALPPGSELPWHRVVNARGEISERPGGAVSLQRRRLAREGVRLDERGRIDLVRFQWRPALAGPGGRRVPGKGGEDRRQDRRSRRGRRTRTP